MLGELVRGGAVDVVHVQSLDKVFSTANTVRQDECAGSVMGVSLTALTEFESLHVPDGAFGFWFKLPGMI